MDKEIDTLASNWVLGLMHKDDEMGKPKYFKLEEEADWKALCARKHFRY